MRTRITIRPPGREMILTPDQLSTPLLLDLTRDPDAVQARHAIWRDQIVLARLANTSIIYQPNRDDGDGGGGGGAAIDRIDEITGEVQRIATLEHGMHFVGPHAVIQNGILAFTTDERILHAFDLATNERLMRAPVRADVLLRLVTCDDTILATYVVETTNGPRTRVCKVDVLAGLFSEPEIEIEAKASAVSSHCLVHERAMSETREASGVIAITAETLSSYGPFGTKLTVLWKSGGDEPLILPGTNKITTSSSARELVLSSTWGTRRIAIRESYSEEGDERERGAKLKIVSFVPADRLEGDWLISPPPSIARRLATAGEFALENERGRRLGQGAPVHPTPAAAATSNFLLPKRIEVRRKSPPVGRTIAESLHQLEERHAFRASALMMDVFSLSVEAPAAQWRLRSLGLTLHDPSYACSVVVGLDPSLVVFGELATNVGEDSVSASSHRLLAFYMYPARDPHDSQTEPPIVMLDPGSLKVTWGANDFDSFFYALLREAETRQPTTVDTILELLGRDAAVLAQKNRDESEDNDGTLNHVRMPLYFSRVHGPRAETPSLGAVLTAQASLDFTLQERLLVTILATDPHCNALMIGQELRKVYRELKWTEHDNAVRRWATVSPR